jgi:hypothetical protein
MSVEIFIVIAGLVVWILGQRLRIKYLKMRRDAEVSWHARTMAKLAESSKERDFILQTYADELAKYGRWLQYNGKIIEPRDQKNAQKEQTSGAVIEAVDAYPDPVEWPSILEDKKET